MPGLKRQIESLPPGLILIRGRDEVAEFLHELPRDVIRDLRSLGYVFLVLPEGLSIEAMPDEVIEELYRERQEMKRKASGPPAPGMH